MIRSPACKMGISSLSSYLNLCMFKVKKEGPNPDNH
nr:MAG TPA: hypothetical protein [Crassvirales sp.]